jgi:hypothetical protein
MFVYGIGVFESGKTENLSKGASDANPGAIMHHGGPF